MLQRLKAVTQAEVKPDLFQQLRTIEAKVNSLSEELYRIKNYPDMVILSSLLFSWNLVTPLWTWRGEFLYLAYPRPILSKFYSILSLLTYCELRLVPLQSGYDVTHLSSDRCYTPKIYIYKYINIYKYISSVTQKQNQLEIWGRAQLEAARRPKSDWKYNSLG